MQRLVEQPSDDGHVFEGSTYLGRVHYHLSVYQHFSDVEGEAVPAHVEVEGRISGSDGVDLADLQHRGVELMLELSDGRQLSFIVADHTGVIRSTGRGFEPAHLRL